VYQKSFRKVRSVTPTCPPPSRGREILAFRAVPLPWWEGLGEGVHTEVKTTWMKTMM
jgi:hypothetical protein